MRFQTPQFIEVEDKIFGPLTLKQFIYLAGSAGLAFLLWSLLPKIIAFFLIIPIAIFGVALAFYRINNKPFIEILEAAFRYVFGVKLYIWHQKEKKGESDTAAHVAPETDVADELSVPHLAGSHLKDMAWSLDVHDVHEERMHREEAREPGERGTGILRPEDVLLKPKEEENIAANEAMQRVNTDTPPSA